MKTAPLLQGGAAFFSAPPSSAFAIARMFFYETWTEPRFGFMPVSRRVRGKGRTRKW